MISCSLHFNNWAEPVHVDVAIVTQLLCKLCSQRGMKVARKVAEGILKGQLDKEQLGTQTLFVVFWLQ